MRISDWSSDVCSSDLAEPEIGEIYDGKVVKVLEFGAFVNFLGPKDGLVHISQLTADRRPESVGEVVKEGDAVKVKVLGFDDRGKVKLSMKVRSEEHTSELQSLMRISYAVFCLKKKN